MPQDYIIEWRDKNLETAIRDCIKKAEGDIWLSDLWDIDILKLPDSGIRDISDLSDLRNLVSLGHFKTYVP